jgi:crotonobetainyl-CoA:carnitine CoA-transferase CaiB-like acyl-CoA transferase
VLEIGQYLAAPTAGQMLADMGAEVVKLEMPPHGDLTRTSRPAANAGGYTGFAPATGQLAWFVYYNRGKQSVCIDVKRPQGSAIVKDLVRHFDVVIENFTPGVLSKYGLNYETLSQANPRLIMCSISGFGQTGPFAQMPANDTVAQAFAGVTYLTGEPDRAPVYSGFFIADRAGGLNAVTAISAALYQRERTGAGQHIDLSLVECLFFLHDHQLADVLFSKGAVTPTRCGPHRDDHAPCGIFKAKDGYLILTVLDHQWVAFVRLMGKPELIEDSRFVDLPTRSRHKLELVPIIEGWLQGFPSRDAATEFLMQNRFLSAPVLTLAEALNHPLMKAREALQTLDVPGFGGVALPKTPYHFSGATVEIPRLMRLLGQDNQAVLQKYLGYDADRVAALTAAGLLVENEMLAAQRERGGPASKP